MSTRREAPIFNMRAVVRETGLTPDALRAWERRYGLPHPERTEGGHRLYSQHDVDILKWLLARQEEGLSISKAVSLWNQLEDEGYDPLRIPEYAVSQPRDAATMLSAGETIDEMREAWIDSCLAYDEQRAEQVLTQAFALYPVETVCIQILQQGLAKIGQGWHEGKVTVQQEHFASELAMRRLETLVVAAPPPTRTGQIVAACPPGENHTFALLLLTLLLRRQGWPVLYLGANVPTEHLEQVINAEHAQLVVSLAVQLHTASSLVEMAHMSQRENVPLVYGGQIFNLLPMLRDRIPGHFLGETLEEAPQSVAQIMVTRPPLPTVEALSEAHTQALAHYIALLPEIEVQVWRVLAGDRANRVYLEANRNVARDISAALALGDIFLLGDPAAWFEGIWFSHKLPLELLPDYLTAYGEALQTHLDEQGDLILTWFFQSA